jgi:serine protease Do
MTAAVERLSESVVSINSTRFSRNFRYGPIPVEGMGSGVIIDSTGYIVTNDHVIDDADRVRIDLKDGRTFCGEVVGEDEETDVALVKIVNDGKYSNNNHDIILPAATLGDSGKLKVGQIAIAVGNAFGLPGGPTISAGVISALGRSLPGADFIFEGLIQTDAAVNPGNSGGPLADLQGNVVGINQAMMPYAQGVGFAIPINTVKRVVEQIIERGRVVRPWLGISGVALNSSIARRFGLSSSDSGVLIIEVSPRSPAYEAGLRPGDVVVQIGSYQIKQIADILSALSKFSIGENVIITLVRMGITRRFSLRLMEAPASSLLQ